ncbi:hypothetical protein ASG43_13815 [Aureimonas sp. Leaf454]|uniref:DNA-3-methyladenine glycosylase family protein n=1 Tax=Aureimonas sp. Leaf454 TaxID=1736381 RepID=UPI0006FEF550|nr:DNA-3-methyladenine glycosylase [Aureimonas sp. Leaf454]KQT44424.1 hypothetical protein ASG43_13815 [Aureimonas sp. Leaf454]
MIRTEDDIARELRALLALAPALQAVADRAGPIPLRVSPPGLRGLVGTMIGQQVSRASADAILTRLGTLVDLDDAAAIRGAGEDVLRAAGLSRAKQRTLLAIAEAVDRRELDFVRLSRAAPDEALAELVRLPGIGPWTAECFLLFSAGHVDIFPAGDLALRAALGHALGRAERPGIRAVAEHARSFAPHRSIAARLLWAFYAVLVRGGPTPADTPGTRPFDAENQGFTKAT